MLKKTAAFKKKVAFMATKLLKMGDSIEVLQEKATKFMLQRKQKGRQSTRRGKGMRSKYL